MSGVVPALRQETHAVPLPAALGPWSRSARAVVIVLLLLGGLLPDVQGVGLNLVGAALAVPVIAFDVVVRLPRIHPVVVVLLPLFGTFAIVALTHEPLTEYASTTRTLFFTLTLASAAAAALIRDDAGVVTLAKVWTGASLVLAALTLTGYSGDGRAEGVSSSPIWLARALATGFLAVLWLWRRSPKAATSAVPVLAVILLGVLATGSRGPLLGVAVGSIAIVLVGNRFAVRNALLLAAAAAACLWLVSRLSFFDGSRLFGGSETEASDQYRQLFLSLTWPVIADNPLGVGIGNWAPYALPPAQFLWPHNLFVEVAVESGVGIGVAFAALTVVVGLCLIGRAKRDPIACLLLAFLLCETTAVAVSGDLNARTFFFLLTLGAVRAFGRGARDSG